MSIISKGLGALALAAAVGLGGAADAAIMKATFAGVTEGVDEVDGLGLFGTPGGTIAVGTAWSAVFIYDTSNPLYGCACLQGGGAFSRPSPIRSATLSLGGVDLVLGPADGGDGFGSVYLYPSYMAVGYGTGLSDIFGFDLHALSPYPHGIENLNTAWSRSGMFYGGGEFFRRDDFDTATSFLVGVNSISIAPVPEPSTWALLILGFGGVGATLRRRTIAA